MSIFGPQCYNIVRSGESVNIKLVASVEKFAGSRSARMSFNLKYSGNYFDQGLKKLFNVQSPAEIRKMLAQQRRGRKKRSEASESSDTVTRDFGDSDELGEPEPIRPRVGSSAVKTKDGLKINLNIFVDLKNPGEFAGAKSYRKLSFRENAATVEADDDGDEDVATRPIQSDEVQRSRDTLVKGQFLADTSSDEI